MSRIHDVPIVRQLVPADEWARDGGGALGDRMEWSNRACGVAALRMILLAHRRPAPSVTELVALGVARDALTSRGWVHAGLADMATSFGVPGTAVPLAADELTGVLDIGPIIISVTEQFPTDARRGGHLVIARGHTGGEEPDILIRDPSAWGQDNDRVSLSRLAASYSGRAITFSPIHAAVAGSPVD